jgi:TRAP-type C4-dicarboxylate transport system substrate-binding protein
MMQERQTGGTRLDREGCVRLLSIVAGGLLLLHAPLAARAQTVWDMATEYPQSAMSGIGMTAFTEHVTALTNGKLVVRPSFDALKGIRSADMLTAIEQGRVQAGDAFAGALEAEDAIFALPSLPFLVTSITDARQLADLARPTIAAALQKRGQRLLYLTPWPPSGIWSKIPLRTAADLAGLSIRTYDRISREVFARTGAKASSISFAELMPRLTDGSINAVLSSGDGEIGRTLWQYLPYFSEITYSLPMSVASVNQAAFDGLTPELREAVDAAGRLTETELWVTLSSRLEQNHQRMRERGVTIDSDPAPVLIAALRPGAAAAREEWCTKSGLTCERILGVFKASGVDLTFAPP